LFSYKGDILKGIIGGTGISNILKTGEEKVIETKYGRAKLLIDEDKDIVLLFRHGINHNTPPHRINYRANIYALYELSVDEILAINSVGSLKDNIKPGSFFIPNDFMEFTKVRECTYYNGEDGKVVHIDLSEPYCPTVVYKIKKILDNYNYPYNEGVYICTEGPRFETKSEIMFYKNYGDVVGMTGYPEVVLAKELGLCYGSLCTVSNYCTGISKRPLTVKEVFDNIKLMENKIINIIKSYISDKECSSGKICNCKSILKDAII